MKKINHVYLKEVEKLQEIDKEQDETKRKIKTILQNNNIKIALLNDVAPTLAEIWNKYEGKQLGEKTYNKILKEFEAAFNYDFFIYPPRDIQYEQQYITITDKDASRKYSGNIKIKIYTVNNFLINNKIQKITAETLKEYDTKNYVENLDAAADEIIALHKEAVQHQELINKRCVY